MADKQKVWNYYTQPEHITKWNFSNLNWHCPTARNDVKIGGNYAARMEAKDGSFGFDFEAVYKEVNQGENFTYEFGGRFATIDFKETNGQTNVTVTFCFGKINLSYKSKAEKIAPVSFKRNGA